MVYLNHDFDTIFTKNRNLFNPPVNQTKSEKVLHPFKSSTKNCQRIKLFNKDTLNKSKIEDSSQERRLSNTVECTERTPKFMCEAKSMKIEMKMHKMIVRSLSPIIRTYKQKPIQQIKIVSFEDTEYMVPTAIKVDEITKKVVFKKKKVRNDIELTNKSAQSEYECTSTILKEDYGNKFA